MSSVQLRDVTLQPPLYKEGDKVLVEEWTKGSFHQKEWTKTPYVGLIQSVGVSSYNVSYDWYVVKLDNDKIIESWWMTEWKILSLSG